MVLPQEILVNLETFRMLAEPRLHTEPVNGSFSFPTRAVDANQFDVLGAVRKLMGVLNDVDSLQESHARGKPLPA